MNRRRRAQSLRKNLSIPNHQHIILSQSHATYPPIFSGGQDHLARLAYTEALSRQSEAVERTLGLWATWWRDLMLVQNGVPQAVVNLDRRSQLAQQAELYRPAQVQAALVDVLQARRRIHANVNLRLTLDVLALRLPRSSVRTVAGGSEAS